MLSLPQSLPVIGLCNNCGLELKERKCTVSLRRCAYGNPDTTGRENIIKDTEGNCILWHLEMQQALNTFLLLARLI